MVYKLKILFFPLIFLFDLLSRIRNFLYDNNIIRSGKVDSKVISVGNISVGGTGKTPLTIWIADFLKQNGKNTAVLSRGYKRKSKGFKLVSDKNKVFGSVFECGDEPFLMAQKLKGIPVAVCEKRFEGAEILRRKFNIDYIVLDDAFQHRKIYRDLDILIIRDKDIANGLKIFPVGTLRESVKSIKRADIILVKGEYESSVIECEGSFKLDVSGVFDKNYVPVTVADKKFIAFSAIADNDSFFEMLESLNVNILDKKGFRDHHFYTEKDYSYLNNVLKEYNADCFITTEKDFVRLDGDFIENNEIYILKVGIKFLSGENTLKERILKA